MDFKGLEGPLGRALARSFGVKKLLVAGILLLLCIFISPLFFILSLLVGPYLIRLYLDEEGEFEPNWAGIRSSLLAPLLLLPLLLLLLLYGPRLLVLPAAALGILGLFLLTPAIAFGRRQRALRPLTLRRVLGNLVWSTLLTALAILPLAITLGLEIFIFRLIHIPIGLGAHFRLTLFGSFALAATPSLIFFFNFAAESHVLLNRRLAKQEREL